MEVHTFDGYEDAMEFSGTDPADFQPAAAGDADEQDKRRDLCCHGRRSSPAALNRLLEVGLFGQHVEVD